MSDNSNMFIPIPDWAKPTVVRIITFIKWLDVRWCIIFCLLLLLVTSAVRGQEEATIMADNIEKAEQELNQPLYTPYKVNSICSLRSIQNQVLIVKVYSDSIGSNIYDVEIISDDDALTVIGRKNGLYHTFFEYCNEGY